MTMQIGLVLGVLGATVVLFAFEILRLDVVAIAVMLTLAWLRLVTPAEAFSGLASNAVLAVLAVMILSYGVDRSGVMTRLTRPILRMAGHSEARLIGCVSVTVGALSGFMQNVGAAALFLPALMRISKRTDLPLSRLLMPMGFAAILGGTLTLVGSGPLIILNDLLRQSGLPAYGLFSVTPIGIALLGGGVLYFLLLGSRVLPAGGARSVPPAPGQELIETWELPSTTFRCTIPTQSPLIGQTREEAHIWSKYNLNLLAIQQDGDTVHAPWRYTRFAAGQQLVLLGREADMRRFVHDAGLKTMPRVGDTEETGLDNAGFAELIIPPRSAAVGNTMRGIALRKTYAVEPIALLGAREAQQTDFSDVPLHTGDAIIVHGPWHNIRLMADGRTFANITPIADVDGPGRARPVPAVICLAAALGLALAGVHLSLALMSGALAMILLGVITIDEAYRSVDWRTVFLLAGLIPLGIAMDKSGAAAFVAQQMMKVLGDSPPLLILTGVAILATAFSLFMSNVAATVLLVPLAVIIGDQSGLSPRALALLVAVCASNSFILPTHQVNALLMGPGGYHNADYVRAGSLMSILFLVIAVGSIYLLYV